MLQRIKKQWLFYKEEQEFTKFFRLATIIGTIIGIFWVLAPTKDIVFVSLVGRHYLPYAKVFSVLFLLPILFLYSYLLDRYVRHKVFYVLCIFYGLTALAFAVYFSSGVFLQSASFYNIPGWLWYGFVESFGVVMASYFWSFVADISTPVSAKKWYIFLVFGAQIGGLIGPLSMYIISHRCGPDIIVGCTAVFCFVLAGMMHYFIQHTPKVLLEGFHGYSRADSASEKNEKKPRVGFFEGLRLIIKYPYVSGIACIGMMWAVVSTVIEFYLKINAAQAYTTLFELNEFFFFYAVCMNVVSLAALCLGITHIGSRWGIQKTLTYFPLLVLLSFIALGVWQSLWSSFIILILVKGLNYVLHDPLKEQLYIPTSKGTKYKAKSWIDTFGFRGAKCVGSAVHMLRPVLQSYFVGVSSLVCCALVLVWMRVAWYVGRCHAEAVKNDEQIC